MKTNNRYLEILLSRDPLLINGIPRAINHIKYWIKNGALYECYMILNATCNRFIMNIPGANDNCNCTSEEITIIGQQLLVMN